ncbi:hypothetical protein CS022_22730 [Veronia nyctiphanis]|uniref:Uncharacterized protein n=1 Tax=Veronia nyctiphanis TaxID=1278244 RepID=A0A4Q0YMQ6_9GAMM|nr:hypothetical protein [Veronia nyctiphanis]RXJ70599.1 hypothetical protein CS022_22730 [Veronia nyctiphanis]
MRINYQGQTIANFNGAIAFLDALSIVQETLGHEILPEDVSLEPETKFEVTTAIREKIEDEAGDQASLLGTTADGVQLLLFGFCQLVVKLNAASTLAEVREAAGPFNDLASSFLTKVESGEVKLPFQVKGLESVVEDIESRATAVAEVLGQS